MLWMRRTKSILALLAFCLAPVAVLAENPGSELGSKVINFGFRPLALPSSIYSETLRRDRILQQELKKKGWSLRQHAFYAGPDLLQQLEAGKLEVAILGDVPTVSALAKHDMLAVATTKHAFASIVSRQIDTIDKLKGKKIGNVTGVSTHYVLSEGLSSAGLKEKDVVLVEMKMDDMPAALMAGNIDAFAAWAPFPEIARQNDPRLSIAYRCISNDYLLLKRELVEKEPEVARLLLAALLRAHYWLKAQRSNLEKASAWSLEASKQFSRKPLPLDKNQIAAIVRRDSLNIAGLPLLPKGESGPAARLAKRMDFLKDHGRLAPTLTWQAIASRFKPQLLEDVLQQPERYRVHEHDYE